MIRSPQHKLTAPRPVPQPQGAVACTPQHLLYRVPKSVLKTGERVTSSQKGGSVIKPREFGKYLAAFRSPKKFKEATDEVEVGRHLSAAPIPPATPLLVDQGVSSQQKIVNEPTTRLQTNEATSKTVSKDLCESKDACTSSYPKITSIATSEDLSNIANPFQPSRKVLRRTPPKYIAPTPLAKPNTTTQDMEKQDGVPRIDQNIESSIDLDKAQNPSITKTQESNNVLHSPPIILDAKVEDELTESSSASSMFKLLSNGYANCEESNFTEQKFFTNENTEEAAEGPSERIVIGSHHAETDHKGYNEDKEPENFNRIDSSPNDMGKSFTSCDEIPKCDTTEQNYETISNGNDRSALEVKTCSTSTSILDVDTLSSKCTMTSFTSEDNDRFQEEKKVIHIDHEKEINDIKKAHFQQQKQLQIELTLERYMKNSALEDMLDMRKQVRDRKSDIIEAAVAMKEVQDKAYTASPIKHILCNDQSLSIESPVILPEEKHNVTNQENVSSRTQVNDDVSLRMSPTPQQLSLDFSAVPSDSSDDVIDVNPINDHCDNDNIVEMHEQSQSLINSFCENSSEMCEEERNMALNLSYHSPKLSVDEGRVKTRRCGQPSNGLIAVPMRSAKLVSSIGYITHEKAPELPSKSSKKYQDESKKKGKVAQKSSRKDVCESVLMAVPDEEEPKLKRKCKKRSPIKSKEKVIREKFDNIKVLSNSSPQRYATDGTKKKDALAHVASFLKSNLVVPLHNSSVDKINDNNIDGEEIQSSSEHILCEAEVKVSPNKSEEIKALGGKSKPRKQNKSKATIKRNDTKSMKRKKIAEPISESISTLQSEPICEEALNEQLEVTAFENFCNFTRTSVEEILTEKKQQSKMTKKLTRSGRSKKSQNSAEAADDKEVKDMLSQMWNVQTDEERAVWYRKYIVSEKTPTKSLDKSSKELEKSPAKISHGNSSQEKISKKKKTNVQAEEFKKQDVVSQEKSRMLQESNYDLNAAATISTPTQLPIKSQKKRQKNTDTVTETENENHEMLDFIPRRKIVKKASVSQKTTAGTKKEASLYPKQGINYMKQPQFKNKMIAIIPKLKTK